MKQTYFCECCSVLYSGNGVNFVCSFQYTHKHTSALAIQHFIHFILEKTNRLTSAPCRQSPLTGHNGWSTEGEMHLLCAVMHQAKLPDKVRRKKISKESRATVHLLSIYIGKHLKHRILFIQLPILKQEASKQKCTEKQQHNGKLLLAVVVNLFLLIHILCASARVVYHHQFFIFCLVAF